MAYFEQLHQGGGDYDYILSLGNGAPGPNLSISRLADGDSRGQRDSYYSLYQTGRTDLAGPPLPGRQVLVIAASHAVPAPRHRLFVNGVEQAVPEDPVALAGMDGDYYLGTWPQRTHFLNGVIAEVLIYDQELVAPERESVEGYLMEKYSVPKPAE